MARRCVKSTFTALTIVLLALGLFTGCQSQPTPTPTPEPPIMHTSRLLAERYLERCPTFVFDGIPFTVDLKNVDRGGCEYCFIFHFEFQSAHAGYGDRGGQVLGEVITTHTTSITVEDGRVVAGIIDDKWDILAQRFLPGTGP